MTADFPTDGVELTHILVVSDLERARTFYTDVLGATLYREYGGTSCVLTFQGSWLLLVTGGGPTQDKPQVTFAAPESPDALAPHIEANADNGLLLLEQSLGWFRAMQAVPPAEQPVLYALATQSLDGAAMACPEYGRIEETRVAYTRLETP